MESRVANIHGVIAKTNSLCSYVCVSIVMPRTMVHSSVIRCKAHHNVAVGCPILFPFNAQLSPVFT